MIKESASGFTLIQWLILPLLAGSMLYGSFPSDNPTDSRKGESSIENYVPEIQETISESDSINSLPNIIYYSDSFNGANDTTSLKNRGYKVFYRGTGPQGLTASWFQGSSIVFPAFNGSSSGYVAANFNAVTSQNNIDNWLILPSKNIVKGDSLFFFSRSIFRFQISGFNKSNVFTNR
ncbi:MAG: choice-of-anchor J domain-containing protein [Ignavibacteria bacterium]|nr:choice-of-anchor J domain-containing protein [Ignavibacteria bacterium]